MPTPNFVARGNIAPSIFVKQDTATDNGVLLAGANARPIGISQEWGREPPLPSVSTIYAGQNGDPMTVYGHTDTCLLKIGDTVAAADRLKPDASGFGVPASSSGNHYGAVALQSGVSGDYIKVQVQLGVVP